MKHQRCASKRLFEHGGCGVCPPPVACQCPPCSIPFENKPDPTEACDECGGAPHVEQWDPIGREWFALCELHGGNLDLEGFDNGTVRWVEIQ